jgi:hypothetical protein
MAAGIRVGQENSAPIELHDDDLGSGDPWSCSTDGRSTASRGRRRSRRCSRRATG